MKKKQPNHPPKLFLQFFRWYCNPDFAEDLEGDLYERFEGRMASQKPGQAKWLFAKDVLSLFRPGIIRSFWPKSFLNPTVMLRHHLLLSYRQYRRSPNTFLINVIGLASGLACAIFIFLWIQDEYQVDRFHAKDQQLYQVMQNYPLADGFLTIEATPGPLAQSLAKEFPEIENAIAVAPPLGSAENQGVISADEIHVKADELYVDPDFFQFFSFPLVEGHEDQVLQEKSAAVISKDLATQLFSSTEKAIGQAIEWYRGDTTLLFTITGVFADLPTHSSLQFDLLLPYISLSERAEHLRSWANSDPRTYVLLKPGVDLNALNTKLGKHLQKKVNAAVENPNFNFVGSVFLQQFSDRYLFNHFENGRQAGGRIAYVRLFAIVAFFLLLIACINFMNLSTAKALHRSKEVGVKKIIGAHQQTLVYQYLTEAILITGTAAIAAVLIVFLLLPQFNLITGKMIQLEWSIRTTTGLLVVIVGTGLLAGSYPAFYLSRFQAVNIFRGSFRTGTREYWMRKGLVVFQFTTSLLLIIGVLVSAKQIDFIQNRNLGYNQERIITIKRDGKLSHQLPTFRTALNAIPQVESVSTFQHNLVGDYGSTSGVRWPGQTEGQRIEFANLEIDHGLLEMIEIELQAGRSFSPDFGAEKNKIIFNEAAIEAMGLEDPIGQQIDLWGEPREIIGVVKDFHFESLYEEVKPCMIRFSPNGQNILIKLKPGDYRQAITAIQTLYQKFNDGLTFEYRFLDEDYQRLYASEHKISMLSRYFAALAILISCLGLFGLAAFTTERRSKEISIRKVLGASTFILVQLLSKDFLKTVLLALLIGIPASYILSKYWLGSFAYHVEIQAWYFLAAGLLLFFIAWSTIGLQTLKATRVNLAQALKDE